MYGQRRIFLLTYMVAVAIPVSLAFNIDVTNPDVYTGEQKDFFGYKVLQYNNSKSKGIIVTAPLQLNGSGAICKPNHEQPNKCFNPEEIHLKNQIAPVKHLGLSIAMDYTGSEFTVCSPSVAHECDGNTYLNSMCYRITDELKSISSFKSGFQECTKKIVDLVFLFDGSGSMTTDEFKKNKDFIVDIMKSLKNSSIKFAAVQFSSNTRKVFDFNDYEAGNALKKLEQELHMKSLTNTHKALKFVLEDILENSSAGASSDATKVLVLITDGDPSDSDKDNLIKTYDEKSIIRFVIGVKDVKLDKIKTLASEPKHKNAFKIENYDGLTGILEDFQKKIFQMEGSKVSRAGNMTEEMSQSGFSAVFHKDTLILGAVGSNSWRGSLQEYHGQTITDQDMQMDSYMGYSVSVGEKNNAALYFTGAPRYEHKGQVVIFKSNDPIQRINGSQIGSYFGAELCSVDINSDGNTDFLLVGAPLFYNPQEKTEGQIYIYALTNEMQLTMELNVTVPSMGRFGTTISSLADLNGDRLRDVAVGAPLEDENRGAVYIYLGDRHRGIHSTFSQRITGRELRPELRFFGQAIDGDIDLGKDGLPDIVVGSHGKAVVLRSRPVFNVIAHLSFQPEEISTENIECLSGTNANLPMVTLTACFEMEETTKSKADAMSHGLNISCMLDVDPTRQTYRGFFSKTDRKARNLTSTYKLTDSRTCFNYSIYMPKCVKDTLSPISIKLNFSQVDSERASAVLNVDSKRQAAVEVPFHKECGANDICIPELEVDFNFTTPTLFVAEDSNLIMYVNLINHGDDSYNTSLTMYYPPGLSYSLMTVEQNSRPTLHKCDDLEGILDKTVCAVNLPVYRSRSSVIFKASFRIADPTQYEWNDTMSMTVTGKSKNSNSTKASMTKSLTVQYEVKMAVTVKEETIRYMNFTVEDTKPKELVTKFQVDNPGLKAFPVNVSLLFPTELEHDFETMNYQVTVQQNKTQCTRINNASSEYCLPEKHCKIIECDTFILDKESATEFTLSANVQFRNLKDYAANIAFVKRYTGDHAEVRFKSFVKVSFDDKRYVLGSLKQESKNGVKTKSSVTGLNNRNDPREKLAEVQIEFILLPDKQLIIFTGVGVGLLLLIILTIILFKLGCFKRKKLPYDQYEEEEIDYPEELVSQSETDGKSNQHEYEGLLVQNEANGNTPTDDTKEKQLLVHVEANNSTQPDDTI
ncbi:integrin alpha-D [Thunnus albacares]|uniref:integrin alpha-D n=1 Tax=Thunnus albacares TaxID=8236 RepID=UPI001CF70837|nr:integrin alpha-D [Thunnus albacares]